jgi:hypothetical protein
MVKLIATCTAGHEQIITTEDMRKEYVVQLAGLMDGSSALYVNKPGPESSIGKCGKCGAQIKCDVVED